MNHWEFPNKNLKGFQQSTITTVNTFHYDDDYGKRLRGAKDRVSVARNMHENVQKQMLSSFYTT